MLSPLPSAPSVMWGRRHVSEEATALGAGGYQASQRQLTRVGTAGGHSAREPMCASAWGRETTAASGNLPC